MKHNSDFKYDLDTGIIGEKHLALILSNKKIEVKTDFLAKKTGNLFVEFKSRNELSGISTTQSDYWCFIISNEQLILIKTDKLKLLCKNPNLKIVKGGDSNTSEGVLLPLSNLLK